MKRIRLILLLPLILSLQLATGCGARAPVRAPSAAVTLHSIEQLRSGLDRVFLDPNFASAQWGVEVLSLDRGDVLYERNSGRVYMPASNNKILTSCAALIRLGPDFRYKTRIATNGQIMEGALHGNLIVIGSGDPSNAPRFLSGDPFRNFTEWAGVLKQAGVSSIQGDIIGDDGVFQEQMLGTGWEWDDLGFSSAAPVNALQFNENLATIEITPAATENASAVVRLLPLDGYVSITSKVLTGPPESETHIRIDWAESGEAVTLTGAIPIGSKPVDRTIAVRLPTLYYLTALKHALQESGIDVTHCNLIVVRGAGTPSSTILLEHASPPLIEIIRQLLKVSQNLYSETLVRTLGAVVRKDGSFAQGKEVVEEALATMAVEKGSYAYVDGSGLSRMNLVSADALVRIFKYMYRHKLFPQFYDALPVGGVDGTIASRMKGTRAENNVHAKTGSISNVRALSGYVRTADGEMLAFSFLANNFLASSRSAEFVMDSALELLSNFRR